MNRYIISILTLLSLVGCGHSVAPLKDLETKSNAKSFTYNPALEPQGKRVLVKAADKGSRGATEMRGVSTVQSSYYGRTNNFLAYSQSVFSRYSQYVSAMYATTIGVQQFINYFVNSYWPNYGGSQFPFWGGGGNSFNAYHVVVTATTTAPANYRIAYDAPNLYGYTNSDSQWGGQTSSINGWSRNGTTLVIDANVVPGSSLTFYAALGVMADKTTSPTLNIQVVATPLGTSSTTATSTAAATVSRDESPLVKSDGNIPNGYVNAVNQDTIQAGGAEINVQGMANSYSNESICYGGYYCF